MTFPDLPCPHCGQLVKLVRQAGRPAFAEPQKVVKPVGRAPPPPWKEPMQAFTQALNAGIREAVAESSRVTLEAIKAIPQPAATVVNYTPPPIELPDPAPIHYTPPPIELPSPAPIHYTPPPPPAAVVQVIDAPPAAPALTVDDVAAVARREASASTQAAVEAITPILDQVVALMARPSTVAPSEPTHEDAEFDVEQRPDGTTRITKRTATGLTEFLVEHKLGGGMKVTRTQR